MFFRYEHSPWSDCGQTLWTQSSGSVTHYQHGQFSDQWSDPHTTNLVTCMVTANKCRPLWVWFRRLLLSQILGKCGLLWHKKWNERLWRHLAVEGGQFSFWCSLNVSSVILTWAAACFPGVLGLQSGGEGEPRWCSSHLQDQSQTSAEAGDWADLSSPATKHQHKLTPVKKHN